MPLPEGRKPLTDRDMITLLHDMAQSFSGRDQTMESEIRQTANRFEELSKFEIESLDPDKRSWYYDGDGTKRRKDE